MASTPLTDAELLAYIERTPECATCLEQINPFNRGYWVHGSAVHGSAGGYMPYKYKEIARAFHAHEQRVREEERKIISAGVAFIMGPGGDEGTRMGLHPDSPYRETVDEQGEAAEAVGLPKLCPACGADTAFVSAFARTLVYRKTLLTIPDMEQTTCDSCAYTYQTHGQHDRNISKIKAAFLAKQGGK